MNRADQCPVIDLGLQLRQCGKEVLVSHLAQHRLAHGVRHCFHLAANGSVIVRQIRVVAAGIYNAQAVTGGSKVIIHLLDHRLLGAFKINGHKGAYGRSHLIQQTARLTKEYIFAVLCHLGNGYRVDTAIVVQIRSDGPQQHLKGCGGGQAGAAHHIAGGYRIVAADGIAQITKPRRHTAHHSRRMAKGICVGSQIRQICHIHLVAGRLNPHHAVLVLGGNGNGVQVYGRRQHLAVIVVRVITADLRASGSGHQVHFPVSAKGFCKGGQKFHVPGLLLCHFPVGHIYPAKGVIQLAVFDFVHHRLCIHNCTSLIL